MTNENLAVLLECDKETFLPSVPPDLTWDRFPTAAMELQRLIA
jgi:hypothetical protein